jgi:hypothetical protein
MAASSHESPSVDYNPTVRRRTWISSGAFAVGLALGCASERSVERAIVDAGYCEVDADCVAISGECPFGCWVVINATEVDDIERRMERYRQQRVGAQCVYDCAPAGPVRCDAGACVMDDPFDP